jgi:hypothetical protein
MHLLIYIYGHISHLHTVTVRYTRKELPDRSVSNCSRPNIFNLEDLGDEFPENKVHHGLGCFTRTYEDNLDISIFTHNWKTWLFIYEYKRILHFNWLMHVTQLFIFSCWRGYTLKASRIIPKRNQVLYNSHECNNNNVLTIYLVYPDLTHISPPVSIIFTHRDVPCTQLIAKKLKFY